MHIISRAVSESIVFEGHATVTVVEIREGYVTLEVSRHSGEIERVTLECPSAETQAETVEAELAGTC